MFAKKSLGQNFLRSKKILADIVAAGKIVPGEIILEAGPGEGALTEALLSAGAKVIAVEKDRRLIPVLQTKFAREIQSGGLTLAEGDILEFSISNFQFSKYKVIANIPYYITGQFLRKFLEAERQPKTMVILVQKEVAERIVAKDRREGLLSISVKAYGTPRYVETVKAGNFSPAPKVDSAILAIENISKENFQGESLNPRKGLSLKIFPIDEKRFFEIVKIGFAHKRKMLAVNLKKNFPDIEKILEMLGIEKHARPENLSLAQWRALAIATTR